jgi:tellurite resistance protein TehA-like permease
MSMYGNITTHLQLIHANKNTYTRKTYTTSFVSVSFPTPPFHSSSKFTQQQINGKSMQKLIAFQYIIMSSLKRKTILFPIASKTKNKIKI